MVTMPVKGSHTAIGEVPIKPVGPTIVQVPLGQRGTVVGKPQVPDPAATVTGDAMPTGTATVVVTPDVAVLMKNGTVVPAPVTVKGMGVPLLDVSVIFNVVIPLSHVVVTVPVALLTTVAPAIHEPLITMTLITPPGSATVTGIGTLTGTLVSEVVPTVVMIWAFTVCIFGLVDTVKVMLIKPVGAEQLACCAVTVRSHPGGGTGVHCMQGEMLICGRWRE